MELALLLAAAAGGFALTLLRPLPLPPLPRLAAGFCAGSALMGLIALALGCLAGLGPGTVAAAALLTLSPAALLARAAPRRRAAAAVAELREQARNLARRPLAAGILLVWALVLGLVLWRVFDRACFMDARGLSTSDAHNIGDLPFHVGVIESFARGGNFPPLHPELAGARLTYPFLADLVTAVMVRAGVPLERALRAHDLALGLALTILLYHLGLRLTGARLAALITPVLVFFSGGMGFLLLARDADPLAGGIWGLLWRLPADYTMRTEAVLRWGNALTTLLVTQRSLLMGLPLFVLATILWWEAVAPAPGQEPAARSALAAAGVAVGLLPLVHGHAFAVALAVAAALVLLFPRRAWIAFFAAALLLALPQVLWMASSSAVQPGRFLAVHLGWEHGRMHPVLFWLWNTGVFLPLLAAALLWRQGGRLVGPTLARFYIPFAFCFVVPNLLRLSPWIWDNMKFLFLWWVASAPLVALVLARLLRGRLRERLAGLALLATATAAGALDVWRIAQPARTHLVFSAEALAFGERLAEALPARAVVLRAPTFDSPVLVSGRLSVLGYEGHIWSQGLDQGARARQIARVYQGGDDAPALLAALGVDYVLLGPQERQAYEVNEAFLSRNPVVLEEGPYRVYRVR